MSSTTCSSSSSCVVLHPPLLLIDSTLSKAVMLLRESLGCDSGCKIIVRTSISQLYLVQCPTFLDRLVCLDAPRCMST